MTTMDHLSQQIERLKKEMVGHTHFLDEFDAMRKLADQASAYSVGSAFTDQNSRLVKEYEQLNRAIASHDSITSNMANIQKATGLGVGYEPATYWNEAAGLNSAASSINASLNGLASKISGEFATGQYRLIQRLGLTASQKLASSILGEQNLAQLSGYGVAAVEQSLQLDLASMPNGLQSSFALARLAGTTSLEKAMAASVASIASEYAGQFDVGRRLRELVGGLTTFDLARTFAIAQLQGVEGLAKQMAALGLEVEEYLDDDDIHAQRAAVSSYPRGGFPQVNLEVFQQLLINLIASYIFALFINPAIPNPDLEAQTKKLARVESLIEKLPQVIEAQVEAIIRRQLLADDSFFVVGERVARLRKSPEDGSSVLAFAFPNQKLKMLEERGKWIRVEFYDYLAKSTQEGWVLKKYCTRLAHSVEQRYREHQDRDLDAALTQTRADMAAGRMVQESPEAHLARLDAMNLAS